MNLEKAGRLWKGCCPFHLDKTPSFFLYSDHFHCFGCNAHGDQVRYVMQRDGLEFREAVEQLAREARLSVPDTKPVDEERARKRAERLAGQRAELEQARAEAIEREDAEKLAELRRRLGCTVSVEGTTGGRYLIETRCIPRPDRGWPDCIRYDAHERALVMVATNPAGEPWAAQWIHLTVDAQKAGETKARPTKLTRGSRRGGDVAVRLPGGRDTPLMVSEGPETALSVWAAAPACEVWIALGSMSSLRLPRGREMVVCADDDARHGGPAKELRAARA